jgi:methyl-accepting chemotaxis protein
MNIKSTQVKLLIVLLPCFILSFGVLSSISYYISQKSLNKSINEMGMAVGNEYSTRVKSEVDEMVLHLEDVASLPLVRKGGDQERILEALTEVYERTGSYDNIVYMTPDGTAVHQDGSKANIADRDYVKKVISTKKPYVSQPMVSRQTGKLAVVFCVPVLYNGQLTGVLAATYQLERISGLIKDLKFMNTGDGAIVDQSGMLLGHPKMPELVGKLSYTEKTINPELTLHQTELDERQISLFKQVAKSGQQAEGQYTFVDGVKQVAVGTAIDLPGGERWVMVVAAPESEVTLEETTLAKTMLMVSLMLIMLVVLLIVVISKRFVKPIGLVRDECLLLSQGDFREREATVDSQDEIGQLAQGFREMRNTLRSLVTKVQIKAEQVAASSEGLTSSAQQSADAANQVAGSIVEIAEGTQTQAGSASRISVVAKDMSASAEQVSGAMQHVVEIARSTSQEAELGRQVVVQATDQMGIIGQGSDIVQTAITELAKGSSEIREIVDLITTIAGQTNLLALNAAIEAARAGEHGRGFAVVAEEVRKLAEQSNQAAQKIGTLIQRNQNNMDQAVTATQAGNAGVKAGVALVNSAGETFKKIVGSIIQLSDQIKEISESINGMASGNHTLVSAIQEIDKASSKNASEAQTVSAATEEQSASMQEIASSSQGLAKLASDLQDAVVKFRV